VDILKKQVSDVETERRLEKEVMDALSVKLKQMQIENESLQHGIKVFQDEIQYTNMTNIAKQSIKIHTLD
jgi:hypothetical protein